MRNFFFRKLTVLECVVQSQYKEKMKSYRIVNQDTKTLIEFPALTSQIQGGRRNLGIFHNFKCCF